MTTYLRGALVGATLGLGWGIAARVWMRLITTTPEFSWTGTLAILGLASWLGLGVGLVYAAKVRGQRPWAALAGLPGLLLFASPGLLFLPAFALGGLASGQRGRILQVVGLAVVIGPAVLLWLDARDDPAATTGTLVVMSVGFALLSAGLAGAGSVLWRRRRAQPSAALSAPIVVSAP
jgi:hypothetical protein